jgi:uncharacterized protein
MATALITGASNGIGLELARTHASKGGNLVLVARNKLKLDKLKAELESLYKISVYTIGKDLSEVNAALDVYNETKKQKIEIEYLINNAGFGTFGMFAESDWSKQQQMIQLNIITLTQFTHLYLNDMLGKKAGKIMNIASTAAFQSGPTMSVYYATKAFVLSFSEAVDNEIEGSGVSITSFCPGPTQSGFQEAAAMEESALIKGRKLPTSKKVAEYGYKAMLNSKTVSIHGVVNYIMANAIRFLPRFVTVAIVRKIQDKVK